ncbi:MAG: alpha/beta fold hydrolase [Clostridia bacterium]|nr:alpha/beta fold hydrolase [Clostridia bacterium]
MNYNLTELTYPSSDGVHTIYAEIYSPKNATAKGVVQLAHGMIDYTGRYTELADYLTAEGYILAGNHHLGHGKSVASDDDYGFFAERGGLGYVLEDMHTMNKKLRETFPALPVILFGHSMGSFLSRLYVAKHPHSVKGFVIHGTGGSNPLVGMGKAVAGIIRAFRGPRHRSRLIETLAFGAYNKRFPKEEGENAWLTREVALVAGRSEDKFTSFKFTVSGYIDLFTALAECNSKKWYKTYPKDMPTYIVSGDADPVGDYGKGPNEVYRKLMLEGASNVELKLYPGARHELFNETNREEYFADLIAWLDGTVR